MQLVLADIPPPPPELPLVGIQVPHPAFILIAGVCLATAVVLIGKRVVSAESSARGWLTKLAIAIVALTLCAAIYSQLEYNKHSKRRRNWVPNGPVRRPPVEDSALVEDPAPVDDPALEEETP